MYVCMYVLYIHAYVCMYTYIRISIPTCVHTYMRTYIHAHIHTCIHTYTHTHIRQVFKPFESGSSIFFIFRCKPFEWGSCTLFFFQCNDGKNEETFYEKILCKVMGNTTNKFLKALQGSSLGGPLSRSKNIFIFPPVFVYMGWTN